MGLFTSWRISFLSSSNQAASLLGKMDTKEAAMSLSFMKGARLVRVVSEFDKDKREELIQWMGPKQCQKVFASLDVKDLVYLMSLVRISTRRVLVHGFSVKEILRILDKTSSSEKLEFASMLSTDKLSEVFTRMHKTQKLESFLGALDRADRLALIIGIDLEILIKIAEKLDKNEVLEIAERIKSDDLAAFIKGLPQKLKAFIYRRIAPEKLKCIFMNLNGKEEVKEIFKQGGAKVFSVGTSSLPQKQISGILGFLDRTEKAEVFAFFDLSKMMDVISSWPLDKQVECIELMSDDRASLLMDEIPASSQSEMFKIMDPKRSVKILSFREPKIQEETIKKLPLKTLVRILELMDPKTQKMVMEDWEFGAKHKVFNLMKPAYAARSLKALQTGARLRIFEGVKAEQCAKIMSNWDVDSILNDIREAPFGSHATNIIKKLEQPLQENVIKKMDLILKNRLGV